MPKLASFQPTPTTTTPAPLPTQVPVAPQVARRPDRLQRWAQERREQNAREQGTQDRGKQREGEPPRLGNQGGRNQDPPPPTKANDPDPRADESDPGVGRGGGNPAWRPDRGDPIDPQVTMMAQGIGMAIANSGKRQADAQLPYQHRVKTSPGPPRSTLVHFFGKFSKFGDLNGSEWTRWPTGTTTPLGEPGAFRTTLDHAPTFP